MNTIIKHGVRFLFFVLVQVLILNQMEIGWGTQIMIYPLFIALLPVDINIFLSLILAFTLGISIDSFSDTHGLHASSLLAIAYFRPMIYTFFAPRDGYEQMEDVTINNMGFSWFLKSFGLLLLIHHFWFFSLEMFKLNDLLYILQKTALSVPMSFVICVFLQHLFIRKRRET